MPRVTRGAADSIRTLFDIGTAAGLSDSQLLERFLSRPNEAAELAFAALVERHGPLVYRVCQGILLDAHAAADAFQVTFLVLFERARSIRERGSIAAWLHGVATRVACQVRAETLRRARHEWVKARSTDLADSRTQHDAERAENVALVHRELSRLPDAFRRALVLCDLEGMSLDQAARVLGCPVGTVKSRLARGRERLRARLERTHVSLPVLSALDSFPLPATLCRGTLETVVAAAGGRAIPLAYSMLVKGVSHGMFTQNMVKASAGLVLALGTSGILFGYQAGRNARATENVPQNNLQSRGTSDSDSPKTAHEVGSVSRITVENRNAREVEALVLQATVHVAVLTPGKSAEGLGTVIMEDEQGTLILTDAHLFENREKTREDSTVRPTRVRITQSMIHRSVEGELLDADHERDVALVRTWAPGLLPFARVERTNWEPVQDLPLIAVSVSAAGELGSRRTTVLLSDSRFTTEIVNKPAYRGLVCQGEAASGNAGAGLFTDYGELVGVCNYNTINSKSSMYASLESIRHLLARNHIRQEVQTHTLERIETLTREEPEVSRDSAKAVVSTKADASMKPDASTKEDLPREGRTRVMPAYVIEPPDLLIVEVPKSPDNARITGERLVRPDGSISLGGYGDVVVSGLTVKQAKAKIVALLRTYLDGDQLGLTAAGPRGKRIELAPEDAHGMFVDVAAYNSKVYYVQGAVASPGRFPITGNETVLDAINYAGGLSRSPKESQVFLIRPKAEGEGSTRLVVDFAAIIHGDAATNFQILPRDRLLVVAPEKVNADTAKPAMPEFERRLRAVEDKLEQILERLPGEPATPKK